MAKFFRALFKGTPPSPGDKKVVNNVPYFYRNTDWVPFVVKDDFDRYADDKQLNTSSKGTKQLLQWYQSHVLPTESVISPGTQIGALKVQNSSKGYLCVDGRRVVVGNNWFSTETKDGVAGSLLSQTDFTKLKRLYKIDLSQRLKAFKDASATPAPATPPVAPAAGGAASAPMAPPLAAPATSTLTPQEEVINNALKLSTKVYSSSLQKQIANLEDLATGDDVREACGNIQKLVSKLPDTAALTGISTELQNIYASKTQTDAFLAALGDLGPLSTPRGVVDKARTEASRTFSPPTTTPNADDYIKTVRKGLDANCAFVDSQ